MKGNERERTLDEIMRRLKNRKNTVKAIRQSGKEHAKCV
jgi:hypothetical protein